MTDRVSRKNFQSHIDVTDRLNVRMRLQWAVWRDGIVVIFLIGGLTVITLLSSLSMHQYTGRKFVRLPIITRSLL